MVVVVHLGKFGVVVIHKDTNHFFASGSKFLNRLSDRFPRFDTKNAGVFPVCGHVFECLGKRLDLEFLNVISIVTVTQPFSAFTSIQCRAG